MGKSMIKNNFRCNCGAVTVIETDVKAPDKIQCSFCKAKITRSGKTDDTEKTE
jgi:hypothetical protein